MLTPTLKTTFPCTKTPRLSSKQFLKMYLLPILLYTIASVSTLTFSSHYISFFHLECNFPGKGPCQILCKVHTEIKQHVTDFFFLSADYSEKYSKAIACNGQHQSLSSSAQVSLLYPLLREATIHLQTALKMCLENIF